MEEEGITVAHTSGGPRYDGPLFTVEPLLTLRQDPDDQESLLFNPSAILPGPDGNYYVCDGGNGRIAVFDAGGEYRRSFGRKGGGPGEFQMMELQSLHDGILSIFDYGQQRTTWFRTDGSLLETIRSPIWGYALALDRTPEGLYLQKGIRMEQDGIIGLTQYFMTVVDAAGRDTLTVVRTDLLAEDVRKVETLPDGNTFMYGFILPYAGSPQILYVPGAGILATDGDRPELTWYTLSGDQRLHIRIDLPPIPITSELRQAYLDRQRARAEERADSPGRTPPPIDSYLPDHAGFWRSIMVDDRGWIWCLDAVSLALHIEGEPYLWHVIDREGCYLGTTYLPTARLRIAGGRVMCFIENPETGESVSTVFILHPAVEGLKYP